MDCLTNLFIPAGNDKKVVNLIEVKHKYKKYHKRKIRNSKFTTKILQTTEMENYLLLTILRSKLTFKKKP